MARVRGILFDLGDTLLDFGPVDVPALFDEGAKSAYAYLQGLGQPLPRFARYRRVQLWGVRWRYLWSRLTRREFNSLEVLGRLSRALGQRLSPEQTEELAWRWYEPLSRQATVEEGMAGILEGFRRDGLALGLVSNTFVPGQVLDRHLAALGLLPHLPMRVYSCDVRYRKPDERIFHIALGRLGLPAADTVFVGDRLRADIVGAAGVGMRTVLKDPDGTRLHRRIRPDHRIRSLAELPAIIGAYNS